MNNKRPHQITKKLKEGIPITGNHKHSEMKVKGIKINKKL